MKLLLLALFLVTGCSVSHFYRTTDVTQELNKNAAQLNMISWSVEKDYFDKEAFFKKFNRESKNKDTFIIQDLAFRLSELKKRRNRIQLIKNLKFRKSHGA